MAEKRLRMVFENSLDATKSVYISIPKADDTKTGAAIKAVMDVIRDSFSIWTLNIGAVKSAAFVIPTTYIGVDIGVV